MLTTASSVLTSEYFLHYVWRTKQFDRINLFLTDGRKVEILDFGRHNTNSGPDFLNGKIRIDDTLLVGHIELHIYSADWEAHRHQYDPAYNSVILHVVGCHDKEVVNHNGQQLLTLEFGPLIDEELAHRYESLDTKHSSIPCSKLEPANVPAGIWNIWKERLNIERLQSRVDWVGKSLEASNYDWETIMYRQLFMAIGTNVNKDAFRILSERLDYRVLKKVIHDRDLAHALVFGMAGMLEKDFEESYPKNLKNTFEFLKIKFGLIPLNGIIWKYSRMHPHNFPDIRLAQIVELLRNEDHFFSKIIECVDINALRKLFKVNNLPDYWKDHFILDIPSVSRTKKLGNNSIDLLIINAVIPVLFIYGHQQHLPELQEKALNLMTFISSEDNHIIRQWQQLNIQSETAQDSQALIQLKNNYCDHLKCLQCSIGHELLKKKSNV